MSKRQLDQARLERRNKQRRLILGAVIVAVFAGAMAAFALSNGSQPGGQEPAVLKTAGSVALLNHRQIHQWHGVLLGSVEHK